MAQSNPNNEVLESTGAGIHHRRVTHLEVHHLGNNTSEYRNIEESLGGSALPPFQSEFESLDFDPKTVNVKEYLAKQVPPDDPTTGRAMPEHRELVAQDHITDQGPVPELRTKVVTQVTQEIDQQLEPVTCRLCATKKETEMIDDYPSSHEEITGKEAEKRLRLCTDHGYLTRHSKENQQYVLTVYKETTAESIFKHFPIVFTNDGHFKEYRIGNKQKTSAGLGEMLRYYEENRIDPALCKIGRCITEGEYKQKLAEEAPRKKCIIL